ncbi:MAG: uroporphyrinogen decarboxylase family protein [Treponema sp.]|nr:uroporphyrinogen decarboxylase family protein [Treponema sp.]
MSYKNAMDAINLKMPKKIPRTEYSAQNHWALVQKVTGITVNHESDKNIQIKASMAFEKAWDYGYCWSILTSRNTLGDFRTKMGHAEYASGGVDFSREVYCPFENVEQVLNFDPYKQYGEKNSERLVQEFNEHYKEVCRLHPDQVCTTGCYITMISGFIEIFGWEMLLEAIGTDPKKFGNFANRYADWILQYFNAIAKCNAEVITVHDDIVWTSGPFADPKWYRKYIFPNYEKLFDPLLKANKKIIFTSDGTYNEFIADIASCGVNGFVMEPTTDMEYVAKNYGKTHCFIGNADCRILTFGTKEDIKKEVTRCINIGKNYPGFFMAVGNHIPSNVPVKNALYYNECYEEMAYR